MCQIFVVQKAHRGYGILRKKVIWRTLVFLYIFFYQFQFEIGNAFNHKQYTNLFGVYFRVYREKKKIYIYYTPACKYFSMFLPLQFLIYQEIYKVNAFYKVERNKRT